MADVFTPEKRSWVMSRIRGRGTGIDLRMGRILAGLGIKFDEYPNMTGNPDFASRRLKIAVFCDGDFWHGYDYSTGRIPRQKFWREKIERNMRRDRYVTRRLRREGWSVLRFWEHDIDGNPAKCAGRLRRKIDERKVLAGRWPRRGDQRTA